jgi:polysaccharide biosynthesis transport protein
MPAPSSPKTPERRQPPPPVGISLDRVYYVLFRHKWKIILCFLLGVVGAVLYPLLQPPPYKSEAKLFIRYVMDSSALNPGMDSKMKLLDERGENILTSEAEILGSLDLAEQVVKDIGAQKILPATVSRKSSEYPIDPAAAAAAYVQKNLTIEPGKHSSIIRIEFQHPNPNMVQPVLERLIANYHSKHLEIHRSAGMINDFLIKKTEELRGELNDTDRELREKYNTLGIFSVVDARKANEERTAKLQLDILTAQAELAERSAAFQSETNGVTGTGSTNQDAGDTNQLSAQTNALPSPAVIEEY